MLRLNYNNQFQKYVEVLNVPNEIYEKVKFQLSPYIIEDNSKADYKIIANSSIENSFKCIGNELQINYSDDKFLIKTLRKSIRDVLYKDFLKDGYTKVHCSSVTNGLDSYIIIGPKRTGKTSTALGLCRYCDFSLIDGDLTLIKDNKIIGWSTPIGTRAKTTEILNIGSHGNQEMKWLWPEEIKKMGYKIGLNGNISKILVNNYELKKSDIQFRRINDINEKKKIILDNIHYEEINKENFWNDDLIDIEDCKKSILSNKLLELEMIECTSNGLSKDNIKKIYRELKK